MIQGYLKQPCKLRHMREGEKIDLVAWEIAWIYRF